MGNIGDSGAQTRGSFRGSRANYRVIGSHKFVINLDYFSTLLKEVVHPRVVSQFFAGCGSQSELTMARDKASITAAQFRRKKLADVLVNRPRTELFYAAKPCVNFLGSKIS